MKKESSKPWMRKQLSELKSLAAMPDSAIDTSDIPEVRDWSDAKRGVFYRPVKQQITLRLDADLIAWFKKHATSAKGYQTRINEALREYLQWHEGAPKVTPQKTPKYEAEGLLRELVSAGTHGSNRPHHKSEQVKSSQELHSIVEAMFRALEQQQFPEGLLNAYLIRSERQHSKLLSEVKKQIRETVDARFAAAVENLQKVMVTTSPLKRRQWAHRKQD